MSEGSATRAGAPEARQLTLGHFFRQAVRYLRARWYLRGAALDGRIYAMGPLLVEGARRMQLGNRVFFLRGTVPTEVRCAPEGTIEIGEGCGFNYGVSLVATRLIRIGDRCGFGSMSRVRDDDGLRREPVVIGNDVWIAHCVLIEPGVTIGDGAVISAGSVVVSDVPPRMLAAGNPARCLPLRQHQAGGAGRTVTDLT